MDYELCLELKNAGFSQEGGDGFRYTDKTVIRRDGVDLPDVENCYIPTLGELIRACENFTFMFGLEKHTNDWRAGTLKTGGVNVAVVGRTPEETMARLYLSLRKNEQGT